MKKTLTIFFVICCVTSADCQEISMKSWVPTAIDSDDADNSIVVDIAQYTPMAFPWVMKLCGEPTRSGWGRMAVSDAIGAVAMAGSVELLKRTVSAQRPDGSDYRSFPSGHTAWAFLGATWISRELGWSSPWYTVGAYTFATGIAVQRVMDTRHFPCDVVAGAGIGIFTGHLGYYIGDLIFKDRQLDNKGNNIEVPNDHRPYLSLETSFIFPMTSVSAGGIILNRTQALSAGIKGGLPLSEHWGLSGEVAITSTSLFLEHDEFTTFVAPQNAIGFIVMPYYRLALNDRWSINAEIGGGYMKNLSLTSLDNAIDCGNGSFVGQCKVGASLNIDEHLTLGAALGYNFSQYNYTMTPSDTYHIGDNANISGIDNSLSLGISTRVNF